MALTTAQHGDLKTRLEMLVSEVAAASDRAGAVKKLHGILENVPASDDVPAVDGEVSVLAAKHEALLDEIDRLGHVLEKAAADKAAVDSELASTREQLAAAHALLEEASRPASVAGGGDPPNGAGGGNSNGEGSGGGGGNNAGA